MRALRVSLVLAGAGAFAIAALVWHVSATTASYRRNEVAQVPRERVALVFGAGVRGERLSRMLAERVNAAIALYQDDKVEKLLMSGDNSSPDYDEVTAMQRYAMARGVPERDITLDYAGFSTYESCFRAKAVFGVDAAVLVTQNFHLPRAVYTCRALGIDAVGLGTPDWGSYRNELMISYTLREAGATLKALLDVHVTHPQPTFLGPFEGIE